MICVLAVFAFVIPLCIETNYATREKYIGVNVSKIKYNIRYLTFYNKHRSLMCYNCAQVLMGMNGVQLYQNLLSWLLTGVAFSIFYILPIIVLFKNTFTGNVEPYLYYSNSFIFWLILTVHVAHLISFGMHLAAYFSKRKFHIDLERKNLWIIT